MMDAGLAHKKAGNARFAKKAYAEAIENYDLAAADFEACGASAAGEASKTYANASECRLRLGDFALAESAASRALELDGANTKARFRRGRARLELGDYEGAMADLGAVVDAGGGDEAEALFREAMSKQRLATFSLALRGEGSGDDALGPRDFFEGLDGDGALARVVDAYRVGALDDGRAPDDAAGLDRYLADAERGGCVPAGWDADGAARARAHAATAASWRGLDPSTATIRGFQDVYVSAGRPLELFRVRALADAVRERNEGPASRAAPPPAPPRVDAKAAAFEEAFGQPSPYARLDVEKALAGGTAAAVAKVLVAGDFGTHGLDADVYAAGVAALASETDRTAALALAAFDLLDGRDGAAPQQRLALAVLSGREAAVDDDEEQPAAWRAGVGSELMAGAWAIVESARAAMGFVGSPGGAAKILRESPCFRAAATAEAWDPTGAFFAAAARLALTAGADALRRGDATAAAEVTASAHALWSRLCAGVAGPDRAPLVALSLLRARAAEQLGDFAAARRLVGSNVGGALHHVALERGFLESENASLDMGEAEAAEVLKRVATRRGPFPERDVAPETDGWRSFDASPGRDVDNFLLADEELTLVLWERRLRASGATRLRIVARGAAPCDVLRGLDAALPGLEALRVDATAGGALHLAPLLDMSKLEDLEVLGRAWVGPLPPGLRRLAVPAPADACGLEAVEALERLEHLGVDCGGATILDLSKLERLRTLDVTDATLSDVQEAGATALVAPPGLERVALFGAAALSGGLRAELLGRGVAVVEAA